MKLELRSPLILGLRSWVAGAGALKRNHRQLQAAPPHGKEPSPTNKNLCFFSLTAVLHDLKKRPANRKLKLNIVCFVFGRTFPPAAVRRRAGWEPWGPTASLGARRRVRSKAPAPEPCGFQRAINEWRAPHPQRGGHQIHTDIPACPKPKHQRHHRPIAAVLPTTTPTVVPK